MSYRAQCVFIAEINQPIQNHDRRESLSHYIPIFVFRSEKIVTFMTHWSSMLILKSNDIQRRWHSDEFSRWKALELLSNGDSFGDCNTPFPSIRWKSARQIICYTGSRRYTLISSNNEYERGKIPSSQKWKIISKTNNEERNDHFEKQTLDENAYAMNFPWHVSQCSFEYILSNFSFTVAAQRIFRKRCEGMDFVYGFLHSVCARVFVADWMALAATRFNCEREQERSVGYTE